MAEEGTAAAVLEQPGTAAPEPSLPVVDETPPDSEVQDAPETDTTLEAAPDSDTDEPRTYTEDELAERVKAEVAKTEESHRRKLETAANEAKERANREAYVRKVTEAERDLSGRAFQELHGISREVQKAIKDSLDKGEDGNYGFHPDRLAQLSNRLNRAAWDYQSAVIHEAFDGYVEKHNPDWKPDRELANKLAAANHRGDPQEITEARHDYMAAAVRAEVRAELEQEMREQGAAQEKVAQTKAGDESRKASTPRPTNVSGGGRGTDPSDVIASNAPLADKQAAFRKKYGFDP